MPLADAPRARRTASHRPCCSRRVLSATVRSYQQYFKKARMMTEVHALATQKGEASGAADDEAGADGENGEKKRPVDSKAAEKRKQDKKKSLKRCERPPTAQLLPAQPPSRRARQPVPMAESLSLSRLPTLPPPARRIAGCRIGY